MGVCSIYPRDLVIRAVLGRHPNTQVAAHCHCLAFRASKTFDWSPLIAMSFAKHRQLPYRHRLVTLLQAWLLQPML
jgi:hypothetical protein